MKKIMDPTTHEIIYRKRFAIRTEFSRAEQLTMGTQQAATIKAVLLNPNDEIVLGINQVVLDTCLISDVRYLMQNSLKLVTTFCDKYLQMEKEEGVAPLTKKHNLKQAAALTFLEDYRRAMPPADKK